MTNLLLLSTAWSFFSNPLASIGTLIWVIVLVIALKNIWGSSGRSDSNKIIWSAVVFFFPVGGVILWWIFG